MRALLEQVQLAGLRLTEMLVRALPPDAALRLGDWLGRGWHLVDRRRRRRASENLRVAFGDALPSRARQRLILDVFRGLGRLAIESLFVERIFGSRTRFDRRVAFHGDEALFRTALESGAPAVLMTGHLGNWELAGHSARLFPVPFAPVVRPIDNRALDRHLAARRGSDGIVIGRRGAIPGALRALRRGTWVGFVADQNAGNQGTYVPFFGLPASTHAAPVWLASRQRVPLFVVACLRRPGASFHYDMHVRRLSDGRGGFEEAEVLTERVAAGMACLEEWIRLDPAQYNWLHRRYKDRPPGETPGPHLPTYDHHRPPPTR